MEANEAVRIDRLRDLSVLAVGRVERLRHLDDAVLADHMAVDIVTELAVDEDLILDDDAALRLQDHELWVSELCMRVLRDLRHDDLCRDEVIVDKPMRDVNLMDGRIVDRHRRRVAVRHFRIAVRAVQQQR